MDKKMVTNNHTKKMKSEDTKLIANNKNKKTAPQDEHSSRSHKRKIESEDGDSLYHAKNCIKE